MNNTTSEDGQYTFDQNAANKLPVAGMDGRLFERTICYNCQTYGHYSGNCNEPSIRGTTLVYDGFVMTQMVCKKYSPISKEWTLLDTQSTMSVFNNKQFLTNIQASMEN
jgi:heat shock protein HslJ